MRSPGIIFRRLATLLASSALVACASGPPPSVGVLRVRLDASEDGRAAFVQLRRLFEYRNPGYALDHEPGMRVLAPADGPRVVFVQRGTARATVEERQSELSVGDLVLLRPGQFLRTDREVDVLVFRVPEPFDAALPTYLRPDWHPGITDTPGGCATETGAYRRVVLTWLRRNGQFNYRALNAHRVRITDSFTHYHPLDGGFDEFYLVQMVRPGARLLTSTKTRAIVDETVTRDEIEGLFDSTDLEVGDLVYIPRGTVHRGLGGVLAHVITTPGFVPGAEIGVDHHLASINRKLGLAGDAALPVHAEGAKRAIRR